MIAFETIRSVDPNSGIENWRAYFIEAVIAYIHGYPVIEFDVPVGYGETELKAIGDLCLNEIKRLDEEAEKK